VGEQTLPRETSRTVVRIGLPFSPSFLYERGIDLSHTENTSETRTGDVKVADGSGVTRNESTSFNFDFKFDYKIKSSLNIVSWSGALAFLGLVLLIVGCWRFRRTASA